MHVRADTARQKSYIELGIVTVYRYRANGAVVVVVVVAVVDVVCQMVVYRPSKILVYLKDGSAETVVRAAALR